MKKINVKSVMIFTLLIASAMATPVMATGYGNDDEINVDQVGDIGGEQLIMGFSGIMGGLFGGMGYAGNLLGAVFQMILMQTLENFSQAEILPNVYTLSASTIETYNGSRDYGEGSLEIYTLPRYYDQSYLESTHNGYAYCVVNTSGSVEYEIEYGAAVTLIIWDNDRSFIIALEKLVTFFQTIRPYMEGEMGGDGIPEELIKQGVSLISWFIIHINDIFTGEELFALNPITWQNIKLNSSLDFNIEKTWKVTGNDWQLEPYFDVDLEDAVGTVEYNNLLNDWNITAQLHKESSVEWLLTKAADLSLYTAKWTSFTFDLIQLWIRTFHVEIDVAEIVKMFGGEGAVDVAAIFQGVEIDFYLFTHHLAGAYLYNDMDSDNKITVTYDDLKNSTDVIYHEDGITPVQVVNSSEVTHRLMLNSAEDIIFNKPEKTGTNKFSWGLLLNEVEISPIPIGVDLESYLSTSPDSLAYISFGFSFEPEILEGNVLKAPIKLDQFFAPFNGDGISNNDISGLDLALLYVSTMLHFSLDIDVIGEDPDDPETWLDEADDYYEETHQLRVGNYLGSAFSGKLEFVDIAGPEYSYGLEGTTDTAPAYSSILPIALYESETNAHETFVPTESDSYQTFAADIGLNISFNVVFYAVTFPEFNGGNGIWHDPTFSVYMVFEVQGFWALILLIAGVGLVGIATILIKKRKDARF
ncbi:MAG: hypothetical protein EU533_01330 [Promethearchaeota archaeon]|nr:MAG: hypothetical protein EU533_01330 [Candidatus Lokiarchaeota archaeon]